jgi:acyl-CoA thioester hydrolase
MRNQSPRPDLLAEYPVVVRVPIAWGEMDAYRHVNNTVFFRYFESARIEYLDRIGFREELGEERTGPILASTHARFRRPLVYPDTVRVGARVSSIEGDRFTMEYAIESEREGHIAAEGGGVLVAYSYRDLRKTALPGAVRSAIEALEGRNRGEVG